MPVNSNAKTTRMHMHDVPRLHPVLWAILGAYFMASLVHFVHNAEYIALYPNMPAWVSRESVCLVWAGISAMGSVGVALVLFGAKTPRLTLIGVYGLIGLDGLGHYALPCARSTPWS